MTAFDCTTRYRASSAFEGEKRSDDRSFVLSTTIRADRQTESTSDDGKNSKKKKPVCEPRPLVFFTLEVDVTLSTLRLSLIGIDGLARGEWSRRSKIYPSQISSIFFLFYLFIYVRGSRDLDRESELLDRSLAEKRRLAMKVDRLEDQLVQTEEEKERVRN